MIHAELLRDQGILIITPEGALQQADFESLAQLVNPYIETEGELHGVLIFTESFPGWADFAALLSHLKFVKNHHQHIAKIAAVTDSQFLTILPAIVSHFVYAKCGILCLGINSTLWSGCKVEKHDRCGRFHLTVTPEAIAEPFGDRDRRAFSLVYSQKQGIGL